MSPSQEPDTGPLPTAPRGRSSYDELPITFNDPASLTPAGRTGRVARLAMARVARLSERLRQRRRHPRLDPYLLDGERVVVIDHRHVASIFLPLFLVVAGFFAVLYCFAELPLSWTQARTVLAVGWLVLLGYGIWSVVEWRTDWLVATDKRLLKIWGLFARNVPMMPLSKVTDMMFIRTVPGRLFGYGKFVLESAGQDQALREINFVRHPDRTYRTICAEMFGVDDRDRVLVREDDLDEYDDLDDEGADVPSEQSRQIPISGGSGETLYRGGAGAQLPDTGPLKIDERPEPPSRPK